jgi:hypothetical protein
VRCGIGFDTDFCLYEWTRQRKTGKEYWAARQLLGRRAVAWYALSKWNQTRNKSESL